MSEKQPPEEEAPASGSRWEKADTTSEDGELPQAEAAADATPDGEPEAAGIPDPAAETQPAPAAEPVAGVPPISAPPTARLAWLRGRSLLVGAGLGVALLAGASGFALAHAVDGDSDGGKDGWGEFHSERWEHGESERGIPGHPGQPGKPGMEGERPDFGQRMDPDGDLDDPGSGTFDSDAATG